MEVSIKMGKLKDKIINEIEELLDQEKENSKKIDELVNQLNGELKKEKFADLKKKISSMKEENESEFEHLYLKYEEEVKKWSGGLITTDRVEFLKQYAFYSSTIQPIVDKYVEAWTGKKIK